MPGSLRRVTRGEPQATADKGSRSGGPPRTPSSSDLVTLRTLSPTTPHSPHPLPRQGDWADSLLELDSDFAVLLGLLDELGIASETLVIFAGDNGPEDVLLWRGTPGYWEGSYFAGGEGNLRTPCIARWPGHIPPGRTSDDIMHVTDWFTTLVAATGASLPQDRVIDGVNQLDWLTGAAAGRAGRATCTGWAETCTAPSGGTSSWLW